MRRAVWLLEQLRREDVEVVTPVDPRVPTGALLKDHIETMLLEHVDSPLVADQIPVTCHL